MVQCYLNKHVFNMLASANLNFRTFRISFLALKHQCVSLMLYIHFPRNHAF